MCSNVSDDTTNLDVCGFLKNTKNLNILSKKIFLHVKKSFNINSGIQYGKKIIF